ncbi:hypothetical protein ACIPV2_00250 [Microbacterium sp. NPDC089987]|uniref:hypothetical protein n=1 Tax=Microbacterium sp. NPDC089987 TaxID=3364202 RepID=UPI003806689B
MTPIYSSNQHDTICQRVVGESPEIVELRQVINDMDTEFPRPDRAHHQEPRDRMDPYGAMLTARESSFPPPTRLEAFDRIATLVQEGTTYGDFLGYPRAPTWTRPHAANRCPLLRHRCSHQHLRPRPVQGPQHLSRLGVQRCRRRCAARRARATIAEGPDALDTNDGVAFVIAGDKRWSVRQRAPEKERVKNRPDFSHVSSTSKSAAHIRLSDVSGYPSLGGW